MEGSSFLSSISNNYLACSKEIASCLLDLYRRAECPGIRLARKPCHYLTYPHRPVDTARCTASYTFSRCFLKMLSLHCKHAVFGIE